jgi:threonine/homoserine/homoserine lactone efflux protein
MGDMQEEPEDFNTFDKWDAMGAIALLGSAPAVMHFALSQEDIAGAIPWLVGMVIAVAAVYLLSFVMPEKVLGRMVNAICVVGTLVLLYVGYEMLSVAIERDFNMDSKEPAVEQKQD